MIELWYMFVVVAVVEVGQEVGLIKMKQSLLQKLGS
jgi:hypothetical protein